MENSCAALLDTQYSPKTLTLSWTPAQCCYLCSYARIMHFVCAAWCTPPVGLRVYQNICAVQSQMTCRDRKEKAFVNHCSCHPTCPSGVWHVACEINTFFTDLTSIPTCTCHYYVFKQWNGKWESRKLQDVMLLASTYMACVYIRNVKKIF